MPATVTLASLLTDVSKRLESLNNPHPKSGMGRFLENMANPDTRVYAFQWAESAIAEAVERNEYENFKAGLEFRIKQILEGKEGKTEESAIATLIEYYKRDVMNQATRTSRSTSSLSNLVDDHTLAVKAKILQVLEGDFLASF